VVSLLVLPADDARVQHLVGAMVGELRTRYGVLEPGPGLDSQATCVVAVDVDGVAVGCVALEMGEAGTATVRRMYVVPSHRGQGLAGRLLRAAEEHAANTGIRELQLMTGVDQVEAVALYRGAGWAIQDRGDPVSSTVVMAKSLTP